MPLQLNFSRQFGKLRDQAVQYTDQRLKLINEVLVGCLVMKMYCWEEPLLASVSNARENEMKYIERAAMIKAFNFAMYFGTTLITTAVVCIPYYYTAGSLESSVIFPVITFFGLFRYPIVLVIPYVIQLYSEARISIGRIKQFLSIPEISQNQLIASNSPFDLTSIKSLDPSKFATKYDDDRDCKTLKTSNASSVILNTNDAYIILKNASFSWNNIPNVPLKRVLTSKKNDSKEKNDKNNTVPKHGKLRVASIGIDNENDESSFLEKSEDSTSCRHHLSGISLRIENCSFYAVVGKIGCGKSSLLSAIIGEIPLNNIEQNSKLKENNNYNDNYNYKVKIKGSIGYARQKPLIFSASVRDNILFGKNFDKEWYNQVIFSCALTHDLNELPHRDETIIGERGINLSGGQKARIGLARAVYSRANILLMDDPLSAVDSVVGKHIFDNVLDSKNGIAKNSIRVLVTHQTQFLPRVDCVVVMDNGCILHQDSLENLNKNGITIKSLIDEKKATQTKKHKESKDDDGDSYNSNTSETVTIATEQLQAGAKIDDKQEMTTATLMCSDQPTHIQNSHEEKELFNKAKDESIVVKEEIAQGNVSFESYMSMFYVPNEKSISKKQLLFAQLGQLFGLILLMFITQICLTASEYWLGIWANQDTTDQSKDRYIIIYIVLVICALLLLIGRAVIFFKVLLTSAKHLHDAMFRGVLYSPMNFFESNPIGRILNRFSKDQWIVDEMLPVTLFDAGQEVAYCLMAIFTAGFASPFVLLLVLPCLLIFIWIIRMFIASSRDIKRLDGTTRSPIFALFGMVYSGLPTIRSFKIESIMLERGLQMIDTNTRVSLMFEAISRWLGFMLDIVAAFLTSSTAFLCVYLASETNVNSSSVGLVLSYMITLAGSLQWAVRQSAELENLMTSTERIVEYKNLRSEQQLADEMIKQLKEKHHTSKDDDNNIEEIITHANWPRTGKIELVRLHAKYRPHLDFVLKDICLNIDSKSKIGIVKSRICFT